MSTSTFSFTQSVPNETPDQGLWVAIRNRTGAIAYERYEAFVNEVFCGSATRSGCEVVDRKLAGERALLQHFGHGTNAFHALRIATETFLLLNAGVYVHPGTEVAGPPPGKIDVDDEPQQACANPDCQKAANLGSYGDPLVSEDEEAGRLPNRESTTLDDLKGMVDSYVGGASSALPYLDTVLAPLLDGESLDANLAATPLCDGILERRVRCPLMLELIWSYWHEAAGQVQAMKTIALRFQNRRTGSGRDPLANLDIDPLRPLSNLIWGYIQDEYNRLSVLRRAYEYDHHYGITLRGKAVPDLRSADSRSKFIEGFHHLLRVAIEYYKAAEDATRIPDGFPLLNALKEVHLTTSVGSGNQFGDLPWQARVEMLMEQWILGRSQMREFLGGRVMVPYPADWMGRVDAMRKLQGWGDASVRYFYDLAVFGERLLLSARFGNWSEVTDENSAKNWANYWRQEVQGYVHAYRVLTGVDLADMQAGPEALARMKLSPADLLFTHNA